MKGWMRRNADILVDLLILGWAAYGAITLVWMAERIER